MTVVNSGIGLGSVPIVLVKAEDEQVNGTARCDTDMRERWRVRRRSRR